MGEGGTLDIMPYLAIARRRGPMVAGFGLLAGLLGAIYALQLVPQYTATATLLLDDNQANLPFPEQAYYGSYADDAKIESELAIISQPMSQSAWRRSCSSSGPTTPLMPHPLSHRCWRCSTIS